MSNFSLVYSLGTQALLLGAFAGLLFGRFAMTPGRRVSLVALVGVAALVPFWAGLPAVYFSRGLLSDPSVPTLVLVLAWLCRGRQERRPVPALILWSVMAFGLPLYMTALGVGGFDLYAWGYDAYKLLPLLLVAAAISWRHHPVVVGVLGLALLAWHFHLLESTNLWDYLLDPLLFFWAFGRLVWALKNRFVPQRNPLC